jgi:threonyl-tRNA synthetase
MSIEFVIIPVVQEFEEYAIKIKDKLTSNITINIHFQIDTIFNLNVNSRINKWKKDDYDIIIINQDCIETNNIIVRFSDKGSRLKSMDLEEFIELVNSFEDEENIDDSNINETDDNQDKDESNCIIM